MGVIWNDYDNEDMFQEFSTQFLWFQARQSPALREGLNKANTSAIFGYYYNPQVPVDLVRTSINYYIVNSDNGRIYKGGATIQIPPTRYINGSFQRVPIYDQIFKGDVLVAVGKPIRDFDVLTKGIRDKIFAFDIKEILSVSAVDANNNEVIYKYGTDYKIQIDGIDVTISQDDLSFYPLTISNQNNVVTFGNYNEFGQFSFGDYETVEQGVISNVTVVWLEGGKHPADGETYGIEFTCSPNYVVWDNAPKPRGTSDNDLSKVVLCVKRAFFNNTVNPLDEISTNQNIMGSNPIYIDQNYSQD